MNEYEKTVNDYKARFSNAQMKSMRERIVEHIKNQDVFEFGPKGDKMFIKFVGSGSSAETAYVIDIYVGTKQDNLIKLYHTTVGFEGLEARATRMLHDVLGMVALWDITLKDYFITTAKKAGFLTVGELMAKYNDIKKDGKLFAIKDEHGDWITNPQGWLRTYRSAELAKKRVPEYSDYPMECKVVELVPRAID